MGDVTVYVYNSVTHAVIQGARVTISGVSYGPFSGITDAAGTFHFLSATTERFYVSVELAGYVVAGYYFTPTFSSQGVDIPLTLKPGQPGTPPPPPEPVPQPPKLPDTPGNPLPLGSGEMVTDTYGNRCDLIRNTNFPQSFFTHRDRYTGAQPPYTSDASTARSRAAADPNCYLPAPPTPGDWQSGISTKLTEGFQALTKYLGDGLDNAAKDATKGLIDLEGGLKKWVQDNFLGKIEAVTAGLAGLATKVETETANRLKGLLDLETRLKAWISGNILELLLLKLMEK